MGLKKNTELLSIFREINLDLGIMGILEGDGSDKGEERRFQRMQAENSMLPMKDMNP